MRAFTCRLCGAIGRRSKEDVLPDWTRTLLLRLFPPQPGQRHPRRIVLPICTRCNGQMGAIYENGARAPLSELISDRGALLSPENQRAVSAWVLKTSLLWWIKDALKAGVDYHKQKNILLTMNAAKGTPPDGTSVRIARFPAADEMPDKATVDLAPFLPGGPPAQFDICGVHTLGYLAFEVVVADRRDTIKFIGRTQANEPLLRVWPPSEAHTTYPPVTVLSRPEFMALRDAYARRVSGFSIWHSYGPAGHQF